MKSQSFVTAPRRAGRDAHDARFSRVLRSAGDDPASLLLMISIMERIVAERRSRRKRSRPKKTY